MPAATTNNGSGYALFDTALGRCAIAWRGGLVVRAALPGADIEHRFEGFEESEPPPAVATVIDRVVRLLRGEAEDLSDVPVDWGGAPEFDRGVWEATRRIPPGETRTYGELASEVGAPSAAQAVGVALGRNPVPIIIPCHRVLASGGRSGGFSAPGGVETKFRLLAIERARRPGDGGLFGELPLAVRPG
jgi:methylated-DNA-[protein]-cysteine S-methyltransferase